MKDTTEEMPSAGYIPAVLEGGPTSIPVALRSQSVSPLDYKIKLQHRGGYEHFERTGTHDEGELPRKIMFHWTMRTEVAE